MSYIFSLVQFFFFLLFSLCCARFFISRFLPRRFVCIFFGEQPLLLSNSWFVAMDGRRTDSNHTEPIVSHHRVIFDHFLLIFFLAWKRNIPCFRPSDESFEKEKCTTPNYMRTCKTKRMPKNERTKLEFLPSNTKSGQFSWTWMLLTFRPSASNSVCCCCFVSLPFEFTFCVVVVVHTTPSNKWARASESYRPSQHGSVVFTRRNARSYVSAVINGSH